ncbi:MAG: hypothetical protein WBM00_05555 [Solirubrobacterales bacterium]
MGSFKRSLLGYRRQEVDAAITVRDARIWGLEQDATQAQASSHAAAEAVMRSELELEALSAMVIERERDIRGLSERLRDANERHDRSIRSLEAMASRLEEIQAQARGQATRIRMKALREAVEVSRRAQDLLDTHAESPNGSTSSPDAPEADSEGLFEGRVSLEIGPLVDFSQLVGFEDAMGRLGASEISVERFSEGRATLSLRLDEPIDLLRELEARSPLDFQVRRNSGDSLILDIDEDRGPEQQAA